MKHAKRLRKDRLRQAPRSPTGRLVAWGSGLVALILVALAVGRLLFSSDGERLYFEEGAVSNPALAELVDMVVDILVWFESSDPLATSAVFLLADMAAGVLLVAALLMARGIYAGRASSPSLSVAVALTATAALSAAAVLLGSLRFLVAFASHSVGLLCPSPDKCGAMGGFLFPYADCGTFMVGALAAAVAAFGIRRRGSGRVGGSGE